MMLSTALCLDGTGFNPAFAFPLQLRDAAGLNRQGFILKRKLDPLENWEMGGVKIEYGEGMVLTNGGLRSRKPFSGKYFHHPLSKSLRMSGKLWYSYAWP